MMKRFVIPLFIPHKGCRFNCIFCNQFSIASDSDNIDQVPETVKSYIDTQFEKFGGINPKYEETQISFYGGSFTCLSNEEMSSYFLLISDFLKSNADNSKFPQYCVTDSLRLSTRPDCITEEIAVFLKKNHVKTVEIGAQTLDDNLLKILNRGHTVKHITEACEILKSFDFEIGIQLMVGIPGETILSVENSLKLLTDVIKPNFIRIYPLIVVKGTVIEKMYNKGEYVPLTVDEAVERAAIIANACINKHIDIARIGLQYTKLLSENIVAGPALPNIGELVRQKVESALKNKK